MKTALTDATKTLYKVFAHYPAKQRIEGCPCCVSDADKSILHTARLQELPPEHLSRFAFKAMTTFGDTEDFKHFLPRIFELSAQRALPVDEFVVLGKLEYGHWHQWPAKEVAAIRNFLLAWWQHDVHTQPTFDRHLLLEISQRVGGLSVLLDLWQTDTEAGFSSFVDFLNYGFSETIARKSSFKTLSETEADHLLRWAKQKEPELERAYFANEYTDPIFAADISKALYILEHTAPPSAT